MTNTIYVDCFANVFDYNADIYVVSLRLLCTKKNDAKRSNKNNHLREVNAKYLHTPANSLNVPTLDPRGSYTDERHSFMRRYAYATSRINGIVEWPM